MSSTATLPSAVDTVDTVDTVGAARHVGTAAGRRRWAALQYVIMIAFAAFFLFPLIYMVMSSLKSTACSDTRSPGCGSEVVA